MSKSLKLSEIAFVDESRPEIPSFMIADDFDHAVDLREALTGLPARPGTRR